MFSLGLHGTLKTCYALKLKKDFCKWDCQEIFIPLFACINHGPFAKWRNFLWTWEWLGPFWPRDMFSRNSMESYLARQRMSAAHSAKMRCDLYAHILLFMHRGMLADVFPPWKESTSRFFCGVVQFCMMFEYQTVLLALFQSSVCVIMFFTFGFTKQWVTKLIICYLQKSKPLSKTGSIFKIHCSGF